MRDALEFVRILADGIMRALLAALIVVMVVTVAFVWFSGGAP